MGAVQLPNRGPRRDTRAAASRPSPYRLERPLEARAPRLGLLPLPLSRAPVLVAPLLPGHALFCTASVEVKPS